MLGPKLENNPKSINPIFHYKKDHLRKNGTVIEIVNEHGVIVIVIEYNIMMV